MFDVGDVVPDFRFGVAAGVDRGLRDLCPGSAVLVFLRHLA